MNIYGLGGIGKSTLLDQYQRIALNEGAIFLRVDSRDFTHTPQGFTNFIAYLLQISPDPSSNMETLQMCISRLEEMSQQQKVVLALDTYEIMHSLDDWLREMFISRLPRNLILIISGRTPLQEMWRAHPHWCELVHPIALEQLSFQDVGHYAQLYNFEDPRIHKELYALTQGHPLMLAIILEMKAREDTEFCNAPHCQDT